MRVVVPILALLLMTLAGCVGDESPKNTVDEGTLTGPLLGLASGLPTLPRETATLEAAPEWRLGEWWRIKFTAPPYGIEGEFDRVVAGVDNDTYLVGMDRAGWNDGIMLLHFPAFGEIAKADLSFEAHDLPISFLRFPLVEGGTWETQWYNGAPLTAIVESVDGTVAKVHITGARDIHITYDATMGAISKLAIADYGGYEVIEHGYGYTGDVRVPAAQDLVFCDGRAVLVQAVDRCKLVEATEPRGPEDRITVKAGYDAVSFGLFLADAQDTGPVAPGMLQIQVQDPSWNRYSAVKTPDDPGYLLLPYGGGDPAGEWTITSVAAGAGLAILEGVAYVSYEVSL
ncbi:MAG: hypothetical protein KY455_00460 [Euryarchaeota archaeon]|nr:hypothetical protein [Euryarchaeota archaeon]